MMLDGHDLNTFSKITEGIIVIGNESKGIQPAIAQYATKKITIPRLGGAESLNAAVATGIVLSRLV
jgi:TrmH family RNA methyltransferase